MAEPSIPNFQTFGPMLRTWRENRRLSQLELAMASDVSARHISFLETGRSSPSRPMVLHLAELLQVPLSARNALLGAAGFAAAYGSRGLDDEEIQPIRQAIAWTLERHEPYPATLFDRHWKLLRANRPAQHMLGSAGIGPGDSMLDLFGDPERMAMLIDNWQDVARHMAVRLRTEAAHQGGDTLLEATASRLEAAIGRHKPAGLHVNPAFIPIHVCLNGAVLSLFSTISHFGSVEDVALADLKMELFFPADERTRAMLEAGS